MKKFNNIWLYVLIVVITALVVSAGLKLWQPQETQNNWITYESQKGFSFQHPQGYGVNEIIDFDNPGNIIIHIVEIDENGEFVEGIVPSLQINVSQNSVSFALWEGRPWEGYPEIINTFVSKEI
jgi:hypothetical protein